MNIFWPIFEHSGTGIGDAYLFVSTRSSQNLCFFDFYNDVTDQLDIIALGFMAAPNLSEQLRQASHRLFSEAECQIAYQEAAHHEELRRRIDPKNYPMRKTDSGYLQRLHVFTIA